MFYVLMLTQRVVLCFETGENKIMTQNNTYNYTFESWGSLVFVNLLNLLFTLNIFFKGKETRFCTHLPFFFVFLVPDHALSPCVLFPFTWHCSPFNSAFSTYVNFTGLLYHEVQIDWDLEIFLYFQELSCNERVDI